MDHAKPQMEDVQTNKEQLLRDPHVEPSSDVIAKALGASYNTYRRFIDALPHHEIQLEWHYYDDGKAWLAKGLFKWRGPRGGQHVRTVFWLSIWDGFFKVTFFIPEKARADAGNLPLDHEVKNRVMDSKQMGKRKHFPLVFELCSDALLDAVFLFVDFRKSMR